MKRRRDRHTRRKPRAATPSPYAGDPFGALEIAGADIATMPDGPLCGRCYADGVELFPANCDEKPEALAGAPLGMYHCPDCGAMVLAGMPHPPMCARCIARQHPGFD